MSVCPCGSQKDYNSCCEELIAGKRKAANATELMRSRYSAHVVHAHAYIQDTHHQSTREEYDFDMAKEWAERSSWISLELLGSEEGEPESFVTFKAKYIEGDKLITHLEKSKFVLDSGNWFYVNGEYPELINPIKLGRNDSCPCESGKKFKKCCYK